MFCYYRLEIDRANHIGIAHYDIIFMRFGKKTRNAFQRFEPCRVKHIAFRNPERRKNIQPTDVTGKIPILSAAYMVHKRLEIALGYYSDFCDIGINHV